MGEAIRKQGIDSLVHLSQEPEWNPQARQRCHALVEANRGDELIQYAHDDLVRNSGVFRSHNLLGLRVKSDEGRVEQYREELRDVASALRLGLALSEATQQFDL